MKLGERACCSGIVREPRLYGLARSCTTDERHGAQRIHRRCERICLRSFFTGENGLATDEQPRWGPVRVDDGGGEFWAQMLGATNAYVEIDTIECILIPQLETPPQCHLALTRTAQRGWLLRCHSVILNTVTFIMAVRLIHSDVSYPGTLGPGTARISDLPVSQVKKDTVDKNVWIT